MASCENAMNLATMQGRVNKLTAVLLGILLLPWPRAAAADDPALVANKVKTAMLLNFTKYVEWPAASFPARATPLVLGVIGKDPLVAEIEGTLGGMTVERRVLVVRQFSEPVEARDCHMIFISASEKKRIPKFLEHFKNKPVLTVSDAEGFIEEGGIICLRKEANNIKFDINQKAAEKAGLKISSKLLQLARPGAAGAGSNK
jgi:hypothetical protein